MLDLNKKFQDKANEIVNEAIKEKQDILNIPFFDEFLKGLISLSLQQGYIYGVTSIKKTIEVMLSDIKGKK